MTKNRWPVKKSVVRNIMIPQPLYNMAEQWEVNEIKYVRKRLQPFISYVKQRDTQWGHRLSKREKGLMLELRGTVQKTILSKIMADPFCELNHDRQVYLLELGEKAFWEQVELHLKELRKNYEKSLQRRILAREEKIKQLERMESSYSTQIYIRKVAKALDKTMSWKESK